MKIHCKFGGELVGSSFQKWLGGKRKYFSKMGWEKEVFSGKVLLVVPCLMIALHRWGEDDETWVSTRNIKDGEEFSFDYRQFGQSSDCAWLEPFLAKLQTR